MSAVEKFPILLSEAEEESEDDRQKAGPDWREGGFVVERGAVTALGRRMRDRCQVGL